MAKTEGFLSESTLDLFYRRCVLSETPEQITMCDIYIEKFWEEFVEFTILPELTDVAKEALDALMEETDGRTFSFLKAIRLLISRGSWCDADKVVDFFERVDQEISSYIKKRVASEFPDEIPSL